MPTWRYNRSGPLTGYTRSQLFFLYSVVFSFLPAVAVADKVQLPLKLHCESLNNVEFNIPFANSFDTPMQADITIVQVPSTDDHKELLAVIMKYKIPNNSISDGLLTADENYLFADGQTRNVCFNSGKDIRFKAKSKCESWMAGKLHFADAAGLNQVKIQNNRVFFTENLEDHEGTWNVLNLETGVFHHAQSRISDFQCEEYEQPH